MSSNLDSWALFAVALFLSPVCFSYAIPNQFQFNAYDHRPGGFLEVTQFNRQGFGQQFGPPFGQQLPVPQSQNRDTYFHQNNGNGPIFTTFTSSSSSSHSIDEPLSFTYPILSQARNFPVFESVVLSDRVDPVFTRSTPQSQAYPTPFFHPQDHQIAQYQGQPGSSDSQVFNVWSQPRPGFIPQNSVMMMTPSPTGGGILYPFGGSSTSESRPLPSFRSIRKAAPGSFFIPVRGRDGIMTYAPEPVFPTPSPERVWNARQRLGQQSVAKIPELPPPPSPRKVSISTTTTAVAQPPRYYYSGGSYGYPQRDTLQETGGRGKPFKSSREQGHPGSYPFQDPGYYSSYYSQPYGCCNSSVMDPNGNDVVYLGHLTRQNPWGLSSNSSMPPPSSPVVRQSRRSKRQNYPRQESQQLPPGFVPGWNQNQPHPQLQPLLGQGQASQGAGGGFPYTPPPPQQFVPQNPQKFNRFGSETYSFNGQNRQFQPGPQQHRQQPFNPYQGVQQGQGFFHQNTNSWQGSELGVRSPSQPPPLPIGWRGESHANSGSYQTITGSPRSREQRPGAGFDSGFGSGWNGSNFPKVPDRPREIEQQQYQQYQIWKSNFTNPYEQKESTDNPKEAKTTILPTGGGEVPIYSGFGNTNTNRIHGSVSGVNETKENYKFTSDSTILQRHLQQAKQVLREQKAREEQAGNGTGIRKKSGHRHPKQDEGVTEQSFTKGDGPGDIDRTPSSTIISSPAVSVPKSSNSNPLSAPSSSGTSWDFTGGRISSPSGISATSGTIATNATPGVQLPQQWVQHQQPKLLPPHQPPATNVFSTNVSKHGRFRRHLKGMKGFASAEELLAMDLEPLDLNGVGIVEILRS